MTKGYLVMAQSGYTEHANALAKSITETQTEVVNISVITDNKKGINLHFDKVLDLPTDVDLAEGSNWKIHNRSRFYELSPYDETVILDADMLFLNDVSHWWNHFSKFDLLCTTKVKTYRNEWVVKSPYRKTFIANDIPNVYSAFTYFKKSDTAELVFELTKSILANWNEWVNRFAPEEKQLTPSFDLALGIAIKVAGVDNEVTTPLDYPTFTHMKSGCQGWNGYAEDWKVHLGIYPTPQGIRLGNHLQQGILHYVDKLFLQELEK